MRPLGGNMNNKLIREYYALFVPADRDDEECSKFVGYFDTEEEARQKAHDLGASSFIMEYQADHEGDGEYTVIG